MPLGSGWFGTYAPSLSAQIKDALWIAATRHQRELRASAYETASENVNTAPDVASSASGGLVKTTRPRVARLTAHAGVTKKKAGGGAGTNPCRPEKRAAAASSLERTQGRPRTHPCGMGGCPAVGARNPTTPKAHLGRCGRQKPDRATRLDFLELGREDTKGRRSLKDLNALTDYTTSTKESTRGITVLRRFEAQLAGALEMQLKRAGKPVVHQRSLEKPSAFLLQARPHGAERKAL